MEDVRLRESLVAMLGGDSVASREALTMVDAVQQHGTLPGVPCFGGDAMSHAELAVVVALAYHRGVGHALLAFARATSAASASGSFPAPPSDIASLWKKAFGLRRWMVQRHQGGGSAYDDLCAHVAAKARLLLDIAPLGGVDNAVVRAAGMPLSQSSARLEGGTDARVQTAARQARLLPTSGSSATLVLDAVDDTQALQHTDDVALLHAKVHLAVGHLPVSTPDRQRFLRKWKRLSGLSKSADERDDVVAATQRIVVDFLQADVDDAQIGAAMRARTREAGRREKLLRGVHAAMSSVSSNGARKVILARITDQLCGDSDDLVHFAADLEGAHGASLKSLRVAYGSLLGVVASWLATADGELMMTIARFATVDFVREDLSMVNESGLIGAVVDALQQPASSGMTRAELAASSALWALLRLVGVQAAMGMSLDRVAGIGTAGGEAFGNAEVIWGEERSAATAMLDTIFAFIFTILDRCRIRQLDSATAMGDVRMEAVSRAETHAAACQGPLSDALCGEAHEVPAIAMLCELAQLCRASAIGTRLLGIDRLDLLLLLCDRGSLQMQRLVLRLVRDVTHGRTKAISSNGTWENAVVGWAFDRAAVALSGGKVDLGAGDARPCATTDACKWDGDGIWSPCKEHLPRVRGASLPLSRLGSLAEFVCFLRVLLDASVFSERVTARLLADVAAYDGSPERTIAATVAVMVLGGHMDDVRVGGRVVYTASDVVEASRGTVVEFSDGSLVARVLWDSFVGAQTEVVDVCDLRAEDEVPPGLGPHPDRLLKVLAHFPRLLCADSNAGVLCHLLSQAAMRALSAMVESPRAQVALLGHDELLCAVRAAAAQPNVEGADGTAVDKLHADAALVRRAVSARGAQSASRVNASDRDGLLSTQLVVGRPTGLLPLYAHGVVYEADDSGAVVRAHSMGDGEHAVVVLGNTCVESDGRGVFYFEVDVASAGASASRLAVGLLRPDLPVGDVSGPGVNGSFLFESSETTNAFSSPCPASQKRLLRSAARTPFPASPRALPSSRTSWRSEVRARALRSTSRSGPSFPRSAGPLA